MYIFSFFTFYRSSICSEINLVSDVLDLKNPSELLTNSTSNEMDDQMSKYSKMNQNSFSCQFPNETGNKYTVCCDNSKYIRQFCSSLSKDQNTNQDTLTITENIHEHLFTNISAVNFHWLIIQKTDEKNPSIDSPTVEQIVNKKSENVSHNIENMDNNDEDSIALAEIILDNAEFESNENLMSENIFDPPPENVETAEFIDINTNQSLDPNSFPMLDSTSVENTQKVSKLNPLLSQYREINNLFGVENLLGIQNEENLPNLKESEIKNDYFVEEHEFKSFSSHSNTFEFSEIQIEDKNDKECIFSLVELCNRLENEPNTNWIKPEDLNDDMKKNRKNKRRKSNFSHLSQSGVSVAQRRSHRRRTKTNFPNFYQPSTSRSGKKRNNSNIISDHGGKVVKSKKPSKATKASKSFAWNKNSHDQTKKEYVESTRRKRHSQNQHTSITRYQELMQYHIMLFEITDFYDSLRKILQDFDIKTSKCKLSVKLFDEIKNKLREAEKTVELNDHNTYTKQHQLDMHDVRLSNFCLFCRKKICPTTLSIYKNFFKYGTYMEIMATEYKSSLFRKKFLLFIQSTESLYQGQDSAKINTFLESFCEQRKNLTVNLIKSPEEMNTSQKKQKLIIYENLLHDFKRNHLELKVILLPEFYSLLFFILSQDYEIFEDEFGIIFVNLYFYFRSLEQFLDMIANESQSILSISQKTLAERRRSFLLSLHMRINFIEPLVLVLTGSIKIFTRYRYHILSLFESDCLYLSGHKYNSRKRKFLQFNLHWVCFSEEDIGQHVFLLHYLNSDTNRFFVDNHRNFEYFLRLLLCLKRNHAYMLPDYVLLPKNNSINVKEFLPCIC